MASGALKPVAIGCCVGVVVCAFVAIERYQANADAVRAYNAQRERMGGMFQAMEGAFGAPVQVEPAMPTVSKYAVFFGALFFAGGVASVLALRGRTSGESERPRRRTRPARPVPEGESAGGD